MTLMIWRRLAHKIILMTGSLALVAVISGAATSKKLEVPGVTDYAFKWWVSPPSPVFVKQCDDSGEDERSHYPKISGTHGDLCNIKTSHSISIMNETTRL